MADPLDNTGFPYPPRPGAGSNAIGTFTIGKSPVGDIPLFEWRKTVISQYANAPILTRLIRDFDHYVDQTANLNAFYDLIWNVDTAQGYGLDCWGRIVGVTRVLKIPVGAWFGFQESLPGIDTYDDAGPPVFGSSLGFAEATDERAFGEGVFGLQKAFPMPKGTGGPLYSGATLTQNYSLPDRTYRMLIFAKAMANITDGSIPSINQILVNLFPDRGNCYVTEGNTVSGSWFGFAESQNAQPFNQASFYNGSVSLTGMKMTYSFRFQLSTIEYAIIAQSGVLPKPTGVAASIVTI